MDNSSVILLVGGSGFVGQYLGRALTQSFPGSSFFALSHSGKALPVGWQSAPGNLLDSSSIDEVVRMLRPKIVVHLAAQASIDVAANEAEMTWRVNFGGTLELASAVARYCPGCVFFFTSSAEVYGHSFIAGRATEETALLPGNPYGASKMAAEYALQQILPQDTRLIIARAFNHTGPGQDERFALPSFAAQIARIESGQQEPIIHVGDLSFERDFLHVSDVVDAYLRLLRMETNENRIVVNVCSGTGHRISDLLAQLCSQATAPVEIVRDASRVRPNGIRATIGDPARLKSTTGWHPQCNINELLLELLTWWRVKIKKENNNFRC